MNARVRVGVALGQAALIALAGSCQSRAQTERVATSAAPDPTADLPSAAPILARSAGMPEVGALPEDAEAGARSVAEWREHLREEERERRLSYDRRRQRQHREVIQRLREVRRNYAAASNEPSLRAARKQLSAEIPKLEKRFDSIDHWRVSSALVPEYAKLVEIFTEQYPAARIAALSGDGSALEAIESEIAARFERIDAELREAVESEDE